VCVCVCALWGVMWVCMVWLCIGMWKEMLSSLLGTATGTADRRKPGGDQRATLRTHTAFGLYFFFLHTYCFCFCTIFFFRLVYAWCCDSHLTDQWLRQLIVGDAGHYGFRERWLRDGLGDAAHFGGRSWEHGQIGLRLIHINSYCADPHLIGPCHMHLMLTAAAEKMSRNHRLKIIAGQWPQWWGLLVVVVGWLLSVVGLIGIFYWISTGFFYLFGLILGFFFRFLAERSVLKQHLVLKKKKQKYVFW